MYNNSLIFMINNSASSVLENGIIPISVIARRRGRIIQEGSNSIVLNAPGYYKVNLSVTFTAPVAGDVTITLNNNGVPVQGITGSETITTAETEVRTITLSGIVRTFCNSVSSLTIVNTGVAIETSNVAIDIEYLG